MEHQRESAVQGFESPVVLKIGKKTASGDQFYNVYLNGELIAIIGGHHLSPKQKLIAHKNTFPVKNTVDGLGTEDKSAPNLATNGKT